MFWGMCWALSLTVVLCMGWKCPARQNFGSSRPIEVPCFSLKFYSQDRATQPMQGTNLQYAVPIKEICYRINIRSACIFFCRLCVRFKYRLVSHEIIEFVVQDNVWQLCECGLCGTINVVECRGRTYNSGERIVVYMAIFCVFSVFFVGFH